MPLIMIENDGQEILATNYWTSEENSRGIFLASINAGAVAMIPGFPGVTGALSEYSIPGEETSRSLDDLRRCDLCVWFSATESAEGYHVGVCQRFPRWIHVPSNDHYCGEFLAEPALLHAIMQQERDAAGVEKRGVFRVSPWCPRHVFQDREGQP